MKNMESVKIKKKCANVKLFEYLELNRFENMNSNWQEFEIEKVETPLFLNPLGSSPLDILKAVFGWVHAFS